MPAYEEEIEGAIGEGVELVTLAIPKRIVGSKGAVAGVEFIRAEPGKAETDGRRRPIPVEGSETTIDCDIVIPAIGQIPSVETAHFINGPELTKWGTIKVNPVHKSTTARGIFAGGDCVSGPASVIDAIAAGQKAAMSIDKLLGGSGELPLDTGFSFTKPDEETLAQAPPRFEEGIIPLNQRRRGFAEVVLGIDREQALAEAGRCLRCDLEK
jgi:NADPH-dependent glutamate synthase beta subunit-like oxidoreductase